MTSKIMPAQRKTRRSLPERIIMLAILMVLGFFGYVQWTANAGARIRQRHFAATKLMEAAVQRLEENPNSIPMDTPRGIPLPFTSVFKASDFPTLNWTNVVENEIHVLAMDEYVLFYRRPSSPAAESPPDQFTDVPTEHDLARLRYDPTNGDRSQGQDIWIWRRP